MRQRGSKHSPGMSPLARRLRALNENGMSYREMERKAFEKGIRYSNSAFEQVAKDERASRLDANALEAVSLVLGLSVREVADLDDERWGINRSHVAYDDPASADLTDIPMEAMLAEIARRTGAANPERKK